jgi:N-dimethylarginine dimethylaminohydrolase
MRLRNVWSFPFDHYWTHLKARSPDAALFGISVAMNIHPNPGKLVPQPRVLVCPPVHFAVSYRINPWMDPHAWANGGSALSETAERQWTALRDALAAAGAAVETLDPPPGLPDLVFTANAAFVLDGKAVLARFRYPQRKDEEPVFATAFAALQARGLIERIFPLPHGVTFEGAGDGLWDARRGVLWMGCGFRSDAAAAPFVERLLRVPALILPLADPDFYHLDTAFCPLPCGSVIYYPAAFTAEALAAIHAHVAPDQRVTLGSDDARRFAANAVCIGHTIVLSSSSAALRRKLQERGYAVVETPLGVFHRSGGSAACLTLRLDYRSQAAKPLTEPGRTSATVPGRPPAEDSAAPLFPTLPQE